MPARSVASNRDQLMLRFRGYLLRPYLASDWLRNNKHSRNLFWFSRFYGKDCNSLFSFDWNVFERDLKGIYTKNEMIIPAYRYYIS